MLVTSSTLTPTEVNVSYPLTPTQLIAKITRYLDYPPDHRVFSILWNELIQAETGLNWQDEQAIFERYYHLESWFLQW